MFCIEPKLPKISFPLGIFTRFNTEFEIRPTEYWDKTQ